MSFAEPTKELREAIRKNDEEYGFHGNLIWMLENRELVRNGIIAQDPKAQQLMTLYVMFERVPRDPGAASLFQAVLKEYRQEKEMKGCS